MSGRIHLSRLPVVPHSRLPVDVRIAVTTAKNQLKAGQMLSGFRNTRGGPGDGPPLPVLDPGCEYFERDVGVDRVGGRGVRRLVLEIHTKTREPKNTYFTDDHYTKGSFVRVVPG